MVVTINDNNHIFLKYIVYISMILSLAIPNLLETSDAEMGHNNSLVSGFDLHYNANVVEMAAVETRDAAGWTNRTGSRKIDWEQEALVKGNITMANNFTQHDWLPCCFASNLPIIDNGVNNSAWLNLAPEEKTGRVWLEGSNLTAEVKYITLDHPVLIEPLRSKWWSMGSLTPSCGRAGGRARRW